MKIVLLGFMGCGKTSIGKLLANKLNCRFIDLDEFIEAETGSSISIIFETKGEVAFRKLEKEYLESFLQNDNYVLATGGGTPCFYNNMDLINKNSLSIYLKLSVDGLFERLQQEQTQRPLLKGLNEKDLKHFITDTLLKREPFYNKAHYKIKAKDIQPGALADFLKEEVNSVAEKIT